MHSLIVTYALRRSDPLPHLELRAQLAPAFAAFPGLDRAVWLANEPAGRFGAFYTFDSKQAFDAFVASELYGLLATNPQLRDVDAHDFEVDLPVSGGGVR